MKYIDLFVQTILILLAIPFAVAATGTQGLINFLVVQFFVGVWQVTSCFLSLVVHPKRDNRTKHAHLMLSFTLILMMIIAAHIHTGTAKFLLLGPPWILAVFYYSISWRNVFPRQKNRSKFLPHISF
jgi:hypothetical protein